MISTFTEVIVGLVSGGMIFFAFFMAPLIFTKLPTNTAGKFIRDVFPLYYLVFGILFGLICILLMLSKLWLMAIVIAVCTLGFIFSRQVLMPLINNYRDKSLVQESYTRMFTNLHRASVLINTIQLIAIFYIFVRFSL